MLVSEQLQLLASSTPPNQTILGPRLHPNLLRTPYFIQTKLMLDARIRDPKVLRTRYTHAWGKN